MRKYFLQEWSATQDYEYKALHNSGTGPDEWYSDEVEYVNFRLNAGAITPVVPENDEEEDSYDFSILSFDEDKDKVVVLNPAWWNEETKTWDAVFCLRDIFEDTAKFDDNDYGFVELEDIVFLDKERLVSEEEAKRYVENL